MAPVPIEDAIKEQLPCVSNCMVVGDKRKFLSVLLTLKVCSLVVFPNTGSSSDLFPNPKFFKEGICIYVSEQLF